MFQGITGISRSNADISRFALYLPYVCKIKINLDLSAYDVTAINLSERRFEYPNVTIEENGINAFMLQDNADYLVIGEKIDS